MQRLLILSLFLALSPSAKAHADQAQLLDVQTQPLRSGGRQSIGPSTRGQVESRQLISDHLFKLEEIAEFALSPDRQLLAYVLKRPKATLTDYRLEQELGGYDRADIWLVALAGGKPRNLTEGANDGAGYWKPVWSPDSQRLAMLSTKGEHLRLWIWEKDTDRLRPITKGEVDPLTYQAGPSIWISNHKMLCPVLPEDQKPLLMRIGSQAPDIAMDQWPKA